MISTSDFKNGFRYEDEGAPFQVMEFTVHNPSARGAATLVKAKVRNLITGQVLQKTYKSGELFEEPDLSVRQASYLYAEGSDFIFMDGETYEQYVVPGTVIGDLEPWLQDGFEVKLMSYNGVFIQVEPPQSVVVTVDYVEPAAKGDTASGKVLSKARLTNGVNLQVPAFIKEGSEIKVDPSTGEYLGRVS